jgi:radical SAM protein with 4Fe4S-binding SPASM domain
VEALSPGEVGDVISQLTHLTWLDVTGGEIFVRKDAEQVIDAIIQNAPHLKLLHWPTNGWFTDRVVAAAKRVKAARPDIDLIITVSLDGPEELHESIRNRSGSFQRAVETFAQLRALPDVSVYIGTTVTRANRDRTGELEEFLVNRFPDFSSREWHWNWLQESEHFFKNGDVEDLKPEPDGQLVKDHLRRRGLPRGPVDLMELGFLLTLERYLQGEPTGVGCQALRSTCFISPEGDVYPCHVWDRPLGNLRETRFDEIWNGAKTLATREEVKVLACGGCFTPCEAYPALAGSPVSASANTVRGLARLAREALSDRL